jgi:hypothetical protein
MGVLSKLQDAGHQVLWIRWSMNLLGVVRPCGLEWRGEAIEDIADNDDQLTKNVTTVLFLRVLRF